MGIESIRIENFRTCRSVELSNLGHLTVLVGRNGVGKSNILQGIEWLATTSSFKTLSLKILADSGDSRQVKRAFNVVFSMDSEKAHYHLRLNATPQVGFLLEEELELLKQNGDIEHIASRKNEEIFDAQKQLIAKINKSTPMLPAIIALKPLDEITKLATASSLFKSIKYYPLDERNYYPSDEANNPSFIPAFEINQSESLELVTISHMYIVVCLLKLYFERREDFKEVQAILGPAGLNLLTSINIYSLNLSSKSHYTPDSIRSDDAFYYVRFVPGQGWEDSNNAPEVNYEMLSFGTRRIIRLLVSIFYDKNAVYLFEQPEDGIHPDLLRKLIDLLRAYSDKGQVIMASHSSELLDWLRPEEVRLVTMTKGETQVRALSDVELEGAKLFLENDGPLSEYLSLLAED